MAFLMTEDRFQGISSDVVLDESSNTKKFYIKGVFLQAEQQNRNGRIYDGAILEREVDRYTREHINKNNSLGELNHRDSPSVDPERACHFIKELKRVGNDWYGKSLVTSEGLGKIVKGLITDGVQLGVSSRGLGTLREENGVKYVNEDYYMSTIDVVSDPSAPAAWVNGIYEGKEFYLGDDQQFVEKVKKHIDREAKKTGFSLVEEKVVLAAFNDFIHNI
jgi:hypothetical protein